MRKMTAAVLACALLLTGCGKDKGQTSGEAPQADGWHFVELQHNLYQEPAHVTDEDAGKFSDLKRSPLALSEDYELTGFFRESVSLRPEDCTTHSDGLADGAVYADAQYGDTWYFDLDDPAAYLENVPEELMPDYVRIAYMPVGSIITGQEESLLISFLYFAENSTETADAVGFLWTP